MTYVDGKNNTLIKTPVKTKKESENNIIKEKRIYNQSPDDYNAYRTKSKNEESSSRYSRRNTNKEK